MNLAGSKHPSAGLLYAVACEADFIASAAEKKHLGTCSACGEAIEVLKLLHETAQTAWPESTAINFLSKDEISDIILKTYSDSLTDKEAADFLSRLSSSPRSMQLFANAFIATAPADAVEVPEELMNDVSAVQTVMAQYPGAVAPEKTGAAAEPVAKAWALRWGTGETSIGAWLLRPVTILGRMIESVPVKVAAAVAVIMLTSFGGYRGYRFVVMKSMLNQADEILAKQTIRFGDPVYGDFRTQYVVLMDSIADRKELAEAERLTREAISDGSGSLRSKQILTHVFIFERRYDKADSVLNTLSAEQQKLPEVLNEFGVIRYKQGKVSQAVKFFHSALQAAPEFKEAYFNMAISHKRLEQIGEALQYLNKYLELETDMARRNKSLDLRKEYERLL